MNTYTLGKPVRVAVTFADTSGKAADPATVICKVKQPNGTITTNTYGDNTLLKDAVGMYHLDIVTTAAGVWAYRFVGSGGLIAASEAEFFVEVSDFGANG